MSRHDYESSPQEKQNVGSETSIVQVQAGSYRLTELDRERLRRLASRPDTEIDFSDIPRLTPEEYEEAKRMIAARKASQLQKAG